LYRVWFDDKSMMLIDAKNKTQAADMAQGWSLFWDRLDGRRVTKTVRA